jgi:hypothetical protein
MSTLGTVLVLLSTLLTALQAPKGPGVLLIVGLWLIYRGG